MLEYPIRPNDKTIEIIHKCWFSRSLFLVKASVKM